MAHHTANPSSAQSKRYRVLNSVGRRLIASFDTEEEAFDYIVDQPGPAHRFAFEDAEDPRQFPSAPGPTSDPMSIKSFAGGSSTWSSPRGGSSARRSSSDRSKAR